MKTKLIAIFGIALYIFSVITSKSKDGINLYPEYFIYINGILFTLFVILFSIYLWKEYKILLTLFYLCSIGAIISTVMNVTLFASLLTLITFILQIVIIWKLWRLNK